MRQLVTKFENYDLLPDPNPWLSVIVPTYNAEKYLSIAFESLLAQESLDFEVLIIDDGSSDSTLDIVEQYRPFLPIRLIQADPCNNWVTQTNRAIVHARGEFISILHQDDTWEKTRLEELKSLAQRHPHAAVLLHQATFIDSKCKALASHQC